MARTELCGRLCFLQQKNFFLAHFDFQRLQTFSFARALDAKSAQWFVDRAVRLADEMFCVAAEKSVVRVIQGQGNVPANIFVGDQFSMEARDETVFVFAVADEIKFDRLSFGQLARFGDFYFPHAPV